MYHIVYVFKDHPMNPTVGQIMCVNLSSTYRLAGGASPCTLIEPVVGGINSWVYSFNTTIVYRVSHYGLHSC